MRPAPVSQSRPMWRRWSSPKVRRDRSVGSARRFPPRLRVPRLVVLPRRVGNERAYDSLTLAPFGKADHGSCGPGRTKWTSADELSSRFRTHSPGVMLRRMVDSTTRGHGRGDSAADLAIYLPRVQLEWMSSAPEQRHRAMDGTLVFSDISGFTPLSERLARRGKVGAEELTDVLNEVFTGLLDVATSYGGDLLKFGGDALLLLFQGDDHAARACTAASALQTALRPYRRLRTVAGVVQLRMSVGVASGCVDLYLIGIRSKELFAFG